MTYFGKILLTAATTAWFFPTGFVSSGLVYANESEADLPEKIEFNQEIRPILSNACFKCHGPDAKERKGGTEGGLRLDSETGATADQGGYAAVVRGRPEASELVRRITSSDPDERMPPVKSGKTLSRREIQLLTRWIEQGAPYARHWSYAAPLRPELPQVQDSSWPKNGIDFFVLARLEREGLAPSRRAERTALVRRLSLDLTGLPPTREEVERFVHDRRSVAYEKLVDRLLAKEAYGERWARSWLDLARYADSAGYADDPPRTIWAFRDYVIRSFNDNKPFDQFTIEQIAGDLLPNPTDEQLVATAFHRNTQTNSEGGTNDEEFRNVAIVDRVNTTMAAWMGTTMACAQCHSHKYEPISQQDYFRLFAVFNSTEDADRRDESPLFEIYTDEQRRTRTALKAQIAELEKRPDPAAQKKQLEELKKKLAEVKPQATVPVMRELTKSRETRIQHRGNYLDTGDLVTPGLPVTLHAEIDSTMTDRLALARWLVHRNNPLTARVTVNRYWEQIFGLGLVRTGEDFGSQGELPSHPQLLDWLATGLVKENWDLKHLLKLLVTSATYQQSSQVTTEGLDRDPDNRLLARGPRFRLSAEMVRDQALLVSGLLSSKMYGPPVKPHQPSLGISAAFGSGIDWKTSEGEDRYRRGLYTNWRRSNPYPSMAAFDAPNREVCTIQRARTNTPLQALVTLNDPVYIEAAQALARRIADHGDSPNQKVRYGFHVCLARYPSQEELERLRQLFNESQERFAKDPEAAEKMAAEPLGPVPEEADVTELAAWTVVSNVLLNLDEMLMKR